jgi:hypothetical protein
MNVEVNPKYEHLRTFVERIPQAMEAEGTYIYGGRRNLIVKMTATDGTVLNVKRFQQPRGLNRLIYSAGLRQPKGRRAFDYPQRLLAKGIDTPEAVAYIEDRNALGLLRLCWLVTIQCPYSHLLYEMGDAQPEVYEPVARNLAAFAAHMHEQAVLHLDFSPGNILWDGGSRFSIVDINRMRFGAVTMVAGCKSFARLWGPKRFIELIARSYANARGFDEDEAVRLTMQARTAFWTRYQRRHPVEFPLEL